MRILNLLCFVTGATIAASSKYTQINEENDSPNIQVQVYKDDESSSRSLRMRRQDVPDPSNGPTDVGFIQSDRHAYYNSTYYSNGEHLYVDLDKDPVNRFIPHSQLSDSFLTADKINLPFKFIFYGHEVSSVLLATGGFLYMGSFFHQYLSATQYVAPLMGSFDPSLNDSSTIRYGNNGTAFTVEWSQVHIKHLESAGSFTFQTTLMNDGRILFAYKNIPLSPSEIGGGNGHKVTVGVSDAFYYDEPLSEGSSLYKRTIYRYDTLSLNETLVTPSSGFILTPLPTCTEQKSCSDCFGGNVDPTFDCTWCPTLSRCSSGYDRHRQEWITSNCNQRTTSTVYTICSHPDNSSTTTAQDNDLQQPCNTDGVINVKGCDGNSDSNTGLIVGMVILIILVAATIGLLVFASNNPLTTAGRKFLEVKMAISRKKSPAEDKYNITKDDAVAQAHADAQASKVSQAHPEASVSPVVITNNMNPGDVSHA